MSRSSSLRRARRRHGEILLRGFSLSFAAALAVSWPCAVARAEEDPVVQHYTVKKGDSCASIAIRFYGESRYAYLLHDANAITGPQPHALKEGRVLVIPAKPVAPGGPDAKLTSVRNQVEIHTPEVKRGHVNDPLYKGNRVATEAVSAAAVTFRDDTQVRLGERTLVVILGDARSAARPIPTSNLVTGNLRAWLAGGKDGIAVVNTESAKVRLVGGESQVSSDAKKTTRLAVYAGNSVISAAATARDVTAGYGSKADLGKAPTVPKPLPPMPRWTAASSAAGTVVVDRGAGSSWSAEYDVPDPAANVAAWHVQIARDSSFLDVVVDTLVGREVRRALAPSPAPGRYYAHVSAVDDDHFEGPFSRTLSFGVVRVSTTTQPDGSRHVSLDPPSLFCVRVGDGPLTRVPDAGVDAAAGVPLALRCATSETAPTTLIQVP